MTETTHLLNYGNFTLASGKISDFKIDCDFLTDEDIETVAKKAALSAGRFGKVYGVPSGGLRLAAALEKYANDFSSRVLIVDDVLTTGGSVKKFIDELTNRDTVDILSSNLSIFVIFSRRLFLDCGGRTVDVDHWFHVR